MVKIDKKYMIVIFFFFFLIVNNPLNKTKWTIEKIEKPINGILLNKYETNRASVLEIYDFLEKDTVKIVSSTINPSLLKELKINDKIEKPINSNICVITRNVTTKSFFYEKISYDERLHWTFRKEWKCKWFEASEWDSLSAKKNKVLKDCLDSR